MEIIMKKGLSRRLNIKRRYSTDLRGGYCDNENSFEGLTTTIYARVSIGLWQDNKKIELSLEIQISNGSNDLSAIIQSPHWLFGKTGMARIQVDSSPLKCFRPYLSLKCIPHPHFSVFIDIHNPFDRINLKFRERSPGYEFIPSAKIIFQEIQFEGFEWNVENSAVSPQ
jgi:hypothetical protein